MRVKPVRKLERFLSAGVLVALLPLVGCQPKNQFKQPPPAKVTVATPIQKEVVETMDWTGTTKPVETVELRSRISGYLQKIAFQDGATVKEGDLLYVIEPAPYESELRAAKAEQQKAEASLQLAEANLARTMKLSQEKATTQAQIDVQKAENATALANVAAAKVAVTQAELNLSYTEIRAPISGQIGRHLVDVGNLVRASDMPLATIESIDPIHVYFYLSESEILRFMEMLRKNELPDPREKPPELKIGIGSGDEFEFTGTLDFRELGLDPGTGTTVRRAIVPNPDKKLIPGLFVHIRAEIGKPLPRLLVEERALGSDQRGDYVLTVDEKNVVQYRPVKLGIAMDQMRVIESGLQDGDRVIVNGLQRARPGATVDPQLEAAKPATVAATQPEGAAAAKP
jgi:RND family efflux transporter MFP subunit